MSSLVGGQRADTSAARAQMEQQRIENDKLREQAQAEKRDMAQQEAARKMARTRGGNRMLLAENRLNPEAGVDETLGA